MTTLLGNTPRVSFDALGEYSLIFSNSHHNDKSLLLVFLWCRGAIGAEGSQAIGVDTMPHIAVLKFLFLEEAHCCLIVCLTLQSFWISYLKQKLNQFLSFLTLYLFSFDENKYLF